MRFRFSQYIIEYQKRIAYLSLLLLLCALALELLDALRQRVQLLLQQHHSQQDVHHELVPVLDVVGYLLLHLRRKYRTNKNHMTLCSAPESTR